MKVETFRKLLKALDAATGGLRESENERGDIHVLFFFPKGGGPPREITNARDICNLGPGKIRKLSLTFRYEVVDTEHLQRGRV